MGHSCRIFILCVVQTLAPYVSHSGTLYFPGTILTVHYLSFSPWRLLGTFSHSLLLVLKARGQTPVCVCSHLDVIANCILLWLFHHAWNKGEEWAKSVPLMGVGSLRSLLNVFPCLFISKEEKLRSCIIGTWEENYRLNLKRFYFVENMIQHSCKHNQES